jgi:hypothetical protein
MRPIDAELAQSLPDAVLCRIVRGDSKGRAFGTPRNPRTPSVEEFNPRVAEVIAGDFPELVVEQRHGLFPEQARRVAELSNEELIRFRVEDPISAVRVENGFSLTGGHHRINEIANRIQSGRLNSKTIVRILVHD